MKTTVEKRKPDGIIDYVALAITTCGVGYIPGAPGTYGSIIGVAIYFGLQSAFSAWADGEKMLIVSIFGSIFFAGYLVFILALSLIGIWASGRSEAMFGNGDPSQAVVDEVIGQLITFAFLPFAFLGFSVPLGCVLAGFLLFRFFDIVKPYPANRLQDLPGGLGICADDIVAGVYAGVCLAIGYAFYLSM
ncbi:MAG: phosphatidylglycerophosphatase A [Pyrinomonadaceae bacterium]